MAEAAYENLSTVNTKTCVWNKRRPDTGNVVSTKLTLRGPPEVCDQVRLAGGCVCDSGAHSTTTGSMFTPTNDSAKPWSTTTISSRSSTYTSEFAEAIVKGAEAALIKKDGEKTLEIFPVASSSSADPRVNKSKVSGVFAKVKNVLTGGKLRGEY